MKKSSLTGVPFISKNIILICCAHVRIASVLVILMCKHNKMNVILHQKTTVLSVDYVMGLGILCMVQLDSDYTACKHFVLRHTSNRISLSHR